MNFKEENYFFYKFEIGLDINDSGVDINKINTWWYDCKKSYTLNQSGQLHSYDDNPALVFYNDENNIIREEWYKNGKPHRDNDEPAVRHYPINKKTKKYKKYQDVYEILYYFKEGKLHRDDNPAFIYQEYYINNETMIKVYYQNGFIHRINEPAIYHLFSGIDFEVLNYEYVVDNNWHNLNGSCFVTKVDEKLDTDIIGYYIFGKAYNFKNYIKQKFIWNLIVNRVRKMRRKILANTLKNTVVNTFNGPDICNLVSTYVY